MSLFLAKKQEDNNQKKVRDLLRLKENKKCFDCPTKSPAFVNTTIQTFICARCSGLVREVGHRVKAISASKFSGAELMALKKGGNGIALKIWLSNYSAHDASEPESDADVRAFMKQKYYEIKWLDRALYQSHQEEVRTLISKSFTEDGLPIVTKSRTRLIPGFSRIPLISRNGMTNLHGDEDEDYIEPSVLQNEYAPSAAMPEYSVSHYYHHQQQPTSLSMPPTSPVCRSSMESINSYSSSSQGGSIYSNHRGSQDMNRNDFDAHSRQNTESTTQQSASGASQVLTKEQIAERCRITVDSTKYAELHQQQQNGYSAPETLPVVANYVLTAGQIAERCRSAVASNTSAEAHQQRIVPSGPETLSAAAVTKNALPPLTINVNSNNNSNKDLTYQKHPSHYQLNPPSLVNLGNIIQSPSAHQQHGKPVSLASAPLSVTPSASNPIIKPTRPSMAAATTATATTTSPSDSIFDSILSDLAGLKFETTVHKATYAGGVLTPVKPLEPSKSSPQPEKKDFVFNADFFAHLNKSAAVENKVSENDPYAALRGIPAPAVAVAAAAKMDTMKDEDRNTSSSSEDDDEDTWQEFCSSSSTDGNEDSFLEPQQVIQPVLEESKPVTNMISIDLFSDLDPRSMFNRF